MDHLHVIPQSSAISYNQPKFDHLSFWNPNGITFADNSIVGHNPFNIFINKNNTIYVPGRKIGLILVWANNSINPTTRIVTNRSELYSIFVTNNGDIYIGSTDSKYQSNQWTSNTKESTIVAYSDGQCFGLLVDINNTLYFSVRDQHKIMAKPLSSNSGNLTMVADTCCNGNAMNMLDRPHGIFIDVNFDLYAADSGNHRIQRFQSGMTHGLTVAGNGSENITIRLNYSASVVLDGDKYLFIVDYANHRIVGSGPYGFRYIVACTGSSGSTSSMFDRPTSMGFR